MLAPFLLLVLGESDRSSETEKLIDRLLNVGQAGPGTHPTAWVGQFLAIDEEPIFRGGIIGSEKPKVDPTMRKLVQMGRRALPDLIEHLSDARPTKLVETHLGSFGAMWFADEYHPRSGDPKFQPPGVNRSYHLNEKDLVPNQKYTLRVGDLCYVAIGQIVNRGLIALRYQPSSCEVINSPIHTPSLAIAVKKDWGNLTEPEQIKTLEKDAYGLFWLSSSEAIKRLLYYYPAEGERVALKLLHRRLYDSTRVWNYADKMMKVSSIPQWKQMRTIATKSFGADAADLIPHWVHWSAWETSQDHPKAQQERATLLLRSLYPKYDPFENVFYRVVSPEDQSDFVSALRPFPSRTLDRAVHKVFLAVTAKPVYGSDENSASYRSSRDSLAAACFGRMAGKGHDAEYRRYFQARLKAIESTKKDSPERYSLSTIREALAKIKS